MIDVPLQELPTTSWGSNSVGKLLQALAGSSSGHPPAKVAAAPLECGRFVSMDRNDLTEGFSREALTTGVTRKQVHAPPLGRSYAPTHIPTVGP